MKKISIFFAFFLIMSIGTLMISQEHTPPKKRTIPKYLTKDEIMTVELYSKVLPTVVTVYTQRQVFTQEGPQNTETLGSGVLISPECHVLTAAHVVDGADKGPVNTDKKGVAIKKYDPVAYFTEDRPVKGKTEFFWEWNGATWHFADAENRNLFQNDPEKYAPQYGGYCAYAMASGDLVDINPKAWKIVNSKLYLNYSLKVQRKWEEDIEGYIEKADKLWPEVLKKISKK